MTGVVLPQLSPDRDTKLKRCLVSFLVLRGLPPPRGGQT